jgi:hypothetical protein
LAVTGNWEGRIGRIQVVGAFQQLDVLLEIFSVQGLIGGLEQFNDGTVGNQLRALQLYGTKIIKPAFPGASRL